MSSSSFHPFSKARFQKLTFSSAGLDFRFVLSVGSMALHPLTMVSNDNILYLNYPVLYFWCLAREGLEAESDCVKSSSS